MQIDYDVSVIVATYNPVWEKLKATLVSIIIQKGLRVQIIITDDGSNYDCSVEIKSFFEENSIVDYKLMKNIENIGTVKNIFYAIENAEGQYVFTTSPGDCLYNENSLKEIYDFAMTKNIDVCYGDAVFYNRICTNITILDGYENLPLRNEIYDESMSFEKQKIMFFLGNYILGAAYFRSREFALKYIGEILGVCRYVEDNTSTAFALAEGIRIYHFKKYLVWYEYGTGISTNNEDKWEKLLDKDFRNSFRKLRKKYKKDSIIQHICFCKLCKNKWLVKLRMIFSNPNIYLYNKENKKMKRNIGCIHSVDKSFIKQYFDR